MGYEEISYEYIAELLDSGQMARARDLFVRMYPAYAADLLEALDPDKRDALFELLDDETASDVLVELETPFFDDVVEDIPSGKLADLADHMAPDDAVRFLGELDADQSAEILAEMEDGSQVSELLRYPEDSAGSIMTTEFCALPANATVHDAREALVPIELTDPVLNVYVVEPRTTKLLGVVTLRQLFTTHLDAILGDIATHDYVWADSLDDQEDVARKFRKYDCWVIPVVNAKHHLVGRITVDDIMDVLHEEADEDLAHMVGAPDIDRETDSPIAIARLRLPWLMITMFAGLLNSLIIKQILDVTNVVAVAIFVPAIMTMSGDTGIQSAAVAIRGIALGYKAYDRLRQIVTREIVVGVIMGLICGCLTGTIVWLALSMTGVDTSGLNPAYLATAVGLAMSNAMIFASCYGSVVPVLLHRLGVDPAVASGPFVTTSNDLSASLIYFLTCIIILR